MKIPERPILEDIDTTQILKIGKFINDKGDKYSGEMMLVFDEQTGKNKLTRHGKGHVNWADGDFYIGDFRNGYRHGYGIYSSKNGDYYHGEFFKGRK